MSPFQRAGSPILAWIAAVALASPGAEIVYADGRHVSVEKPRKDSKGRWMAEIEGHTVVLKPGEVAVVVDDAGKEAVLIPPLLATPDPPETAALLASLVDPKNDQWLAQTAAQLAEKPTRGVLDALVALTNDKKKETRGRAIGALARLSTKESVTAATTALLAEKDAALRRDAASNLFSVQEIFKRCDAAKSLTAGLADPDAGVRYVFAMLAPPDLEAANAVLRNDGLKSSDHHVRESSARELGKRGDRSGESLLIEMLARTKLTGVSDDPATAERLLIAENVDLCAILGKFGTANAKAALAKAAKSKLEPIKKAAEAALAGAK